MKATSFPLCKAASKKHRAGIQWFASLLGVTEGKTHPQNRPNLKRSMEFYSIYAETGDERYLGLCEDFLKDSLVRR